MVGFLMRSDETLQNRHAEPPRMEEVDPAASPLHICAKNVADLRDCEERVDD